MISWLNKSKQTLNPVPIVTTARGERETVLVLSSEQKDSGSFMQKAYFFGEGGSSFQKIRTKKTQFHKGYHLVSPSRHTSANQQGRNWQVK